MKNIVTIIVALAVGIAVGVVGGQQVLGARTSETGQAQAGKGATAELPKERALVDSLNAENQRLNESNKELLAKLDELQLRIQSAEAKATALADMGVAAEDFGELFAGLASAAESAPRVRPGGSGGGFGRPEGEITEEQRAEWQARREQGRAEMRERMTNYFDQAYERAPDAAAQERVAAIEQNITYMMDLFRDMRSVETDEDRQAYREAIGQVRDNLNSVIAEEGAARIRAAAAAQGVSNPEAQNAIIQTVTDMYSDPMFRIPSMLAGGPGSGAGFGAFGGGGGFRRSGDGQAPPQP